jgi:hypothetical protein
MKETVLHGITTEETKRQVGGFWVKERKAVH